MNVPLNLGSKTIDDDDDDDDDDVIFSGKCFLLCNNRNYRY